MNWINLRLNAQNIVYETEKSVLVQVPARVCANLGLSERHVFWHPKKLVRPEGDGGNGYCWTLGLTEDFEIKIFKNGQGKYNLDTKISEHTFSGEQLINAWEKH